MVTPAGTDPNLPDVVYRVDAMDANGNILATGYSSSTTQRNGPVAIHVFVGSFSYVYESSFAGVWSNTPIAAATFTNAEDTGEGPRACVGAIAFSNKPLTSYKAFVQPPINSDASSVFSANRGVIPVKFTLTQNGTPTCVLPEATIAVFLISGATVVPIEVGVYSTPADIGSNFRIDPTDCQYVYNLSASSLGAGTYRVTISIDGGVVGSAVFALK